MRKIKSNLLGGHVRKLSVTTTIFILIVAGSICSALASYSFAKYETDPGKPGRNKARFDYSEIGLLYTGF
jgi:hypothetical protein